MRPPIAIVGTGCRLPGGINDLDSLWHMLKEGGTTWSDVPSDRYAWESFHHPSRGAPASHTHRGGHFLDQDVCAFDSKFFGISSEEAKAMDPQQRILLEVAYEALENAGIALNDIRGSNTGVWIATFTHDYENMQYRDLLSVPKYFMTGTGSAIASNRISHFFDLRGPSTTLDTGCSGSLVGIHQACQSLQLEETSIALVGGTNLILSSDTMIPMDAAHLLNKDGRSFSFDSRGSGYGRGEGVTVIVLKRLSDALKSNDSILGVIRSSAVGQNGRTRNITMPSEEAQRSLIRNAYKAVSWSPCDTSYVEAHGTGTVAGDIAELNAIKEVFCGERRTPLFVGSIKANIGHLESTSGLAGLLKALLVLDRGAIPAVPGLNKLKSGLGCLPSFIEIPRSQHLWPAGVARRASLSSFGYGGTNAHLIIEKASDALMATGEKKIHPECDDEEGCANVNLIEGALAGRTPGMSLTFNTARAVDADVERTRIVLISAASETSLTARMVQLREWCRTRMQSAFLEDLSYTLASRRSSLSWRNVLVACSEQQLLMSLDQSAMNPVRPHPNNSVCYIFTGQGAQWLAMARELFPFEPFTRSIARSEQILHQLDSPWSLFEELLRSEEESWVGRSEIGQPATCAIQIAIVDLLDTLRLKPQMVLGHSSGEIAAAYAAKALSHESALTIAFHRGSLAKRCNNILGVKGAMLALSCGEAFVASHMDKLTSGRVMIACVNSPSSTVVSGDESAIDELNDMMEAFAIPARKLRVDAAYHSHHMQSVASIYLESIKHIRLEQPGGTIKFYSSVTGGEKTSEFGPHYWVNNLTSKVRFRDALQTLCEDLQAAVSNSSTLTIFLEIGASSTLITPAKQTITKLKLDSFQAAYASVMERNRNDPTALFHLMALLARHGACVDLDAVNTSLCSHTPPKVISTLPPYPFDHSTRHWHESYIMKQYRLRSHPYHDLVGLRVPGDTTLEPVWRHHLSLESLPWLLDHQVENRVVFPGSGYLAMVIQAVHQISSVRLAESKATIESYVLTDTIFSKTLELLSSADEVELRLTLRFKNSRQPHNVDDEQDFCISSVSFDGEVQEHCRGSVAIRIKTTSLQEDPLSVRTVDGKSIEQSQYPAFDMQSIYESMRSKGNHWGEKFAAVTELNATDRHAVGKVTIPDIAQSMPGNFQHSHVIHPATLDALIHTSLMLYSRAYSSSVILPVAIESMILSASVPTLPGTQLDFDTSIHSEASSSMDFDLTVRQAGESIGLHPWIQIRNGKLRGSTELQTPIQRDQNTEVYALEWGIDVDYCTPSFEDADQRAEIEQQERVIILNASASSFLESTLPEFQSGTIESRYSSYVEWMERHTNASQPRLENGQGPAMKVADACPSVEGEILNRVGTNLVSILKGQIDPLSLLLEGNLLPRFYAESASSIRCYQHAANYIEKVLFKQPKIKILEVGAGTGGATLYLLQALSGNEKLTQRLQYDVTDITSGFKEIAEDRLKHWASLLTFSTLDISKDPVPQGFFGARYDIVLASNSLHAAQSIDDALAHIEFLLKPGGKLVLIEITRLLSYMSAIFGLLPGWFMERNDGRDSSPVMTVQEWDSRLRMHQFDGLRIATNDFEGSAHQMTMMVAERTKQEIKQRDCLVYPSLSSQVALESTYGSLHLDLCEELNQKGKRAMVGDLPTLMGDIDVVHVILNDIGCSTSQALAWSTNGLTVSAARGVKGVIVINFRRKNIQLYHHFVEILQRRKELRGDTFSFLPITLNAEAFDDIPGIVQSLVGIIDKCFSVPEKDVAKETRFSCSNGRTFIPRIVPYRSLDSIIRRHESQQIGQQRETEQARASNSQAVALDQKGTYILAGEFGEASITICQYLATRGAKQVAVPAGETPNHGHKQILNELRRRSIVTEAMSWSAVVAGKHNWPPLKGIFLGQMQDSESPEWVDGLSSFGTSADCLHESCPHLEFLLVVSPTTQILNDPPYLDGRFSFNLRASRKAHLFIDSLDEYRLLGTSQSPRIGGQPKPSKQREFFTSLDSLRGSQSMNNSVLEFITGTDPLVISTHDPNLDPRNPYFNHLFHTQAMSPKGKDPPQKASSTLKSFAEASDPQEATQIVTRDLVLKICTYVAVETDMLDLNTKLEDLGVDSLVVFRLRSWIFTAFQAPLEAGDITSASGISILASMIVGRSSTVKNRLGERNHKGDPALEATGLAHSIVKHSVEEKVILPKQPLPDLGNSLKQFLDKARIVCNGQEYSRTVVAARELEDDSVGLRLHERLKERFDNPNTENWLAELYPVRRYLRQRSPLLGHQSYFGTHPLPRTTMDASSRAATIILAVHKFKKALETGQLPKQHLYGQAVDSDSYQWLFNACREPGLHEDRLVKHASNDDIVILRHGIIFRIPLTENRVLISHPKLASTLTAISDNTDTRGDPDVSALTMDERDEWAKIRANLKIASDANEETLQSIAAAAFIVCLDSAKPSGPEERFRHFLLGRKNRWYDKTLQIIVCANGVSAVLCEHSGLDGLSVESLSDFINAALEESEDKDDSVCVPAAANGGSIRPRMLPMLVDQTSRDRISFLQDKALTISGNFTFASMTVSDFGNDFFIARKCPVQSGIQISIQLASRLFFNYSPPAIETVSMATFRKGRVEVHYVLNKAMMKFIDAASDEGSTLSRETVRARAYDAAKGHARSLRHTSKGHGFGRHLLAMEWMLNEGETVPEFFRDPAYLRLKAARVVTSTFQTGWVEGGFVYPVPESILVYVEIKDQSASFSIFGNRVNAEEFRGKLGKAANFIKDLLVE